MERQRSYTAIIGWAWNLEVYSFFGTFLEVVQQAEDCALDKGEGALVYSLTLDPN